MHQIGSGMYVSGRAAPDRKRERQLSSGSVATPPYTGGDLSRSGELGRMFDVSAAPSPASSSRRSSGPLPPSRPSPLSGPLAQLSHSGLLVGPSPPRAPTPSPARGGSRRKARRTRHAAAAAPATVSRGRIRLGVPFACYVLLAVVAAAGVGAGVFFLVAWHRWEPLAAACGASSAALAAISWNAGRSAAEAERSFRLFPDTVFDVDGGHQPASGELVKITGQVTCGPVAVGGCFHDAAARCVFTSVRVYERRGRWASCCYRWKLRHSEARSTNFYISDRSSGKRFYVRAGEGAKVTWMIKPRTATSFDGGDGKGGTSSRSLENWAAASGLSVAGAARVEEGFIREGDTASVVGVLRRHHGCDVVDAPAGAAAAGCRPARCMFPVLVDGLVLIGGEEGPDDAVYMV